MSSNSWCQALATLKVAGPAVSNTTTATSLLGTGASQDARFNLPSNFLVVGSQFQIRAGGVISTAASAPGTLTFSVQIGSVVVYTGAASPTLVTSLSNSPFYLEIDMTVRAVGGGTNAQIYGTGVATSGAFSASTPTMLLGGSAGSGFDSTASGFVDFFATWSVASASNSINLTNYSLISLN